MRFLTGDENYPPRWATFDEGIHLGHVLEFQFAGTVADVRRFGARYRAARCFRYVQFDGMTQKTADGYSALCQMLLTYSAFEYFMRALGIELERTSTLLTAAESQKVLSRVRALDSGDALVKFLRSHLRKRYQTELDLYLTNRPCNPFFLAAGIRHLFAHGDLTPNAKDGARRTIPCVATVSRYITQVLRKVMDREFEKQVDAFEAARRKSAQSS